MQVVQRNVSIASEGDGAIVDGVGLSRLFLVSSGARLELTNVHLCNGRASNLSPGGPRGGGILVLRNSELIMQGGTVSSCKAIDEAGMDNSAGGGLYLGDGSTARLRLAQLSDCSCGSDSTYTFAGGGAAAVFLDSRLILVDSRVSNSSAVASPFAAAAGGGIMSKGGSSVHLVNSEVTDCVAHAEKFARGGGLQAEGGLLRLEASLVARCSVAVSSATGIIGSLAMGGGISLDAQVSAALDFSSVSHCHALAPFTLLANARGGGIQASNVQMLMMNSSEIADCTCGVYTSLGGGLYVRTHSRVDVTGSAILRCGAVLADTLSLLLESHPGLVHLQQRRALQPWLSPEMPLPIYFQGWESYIEEERPVDRNAGGGGVTATNGSLVELSDSVISGCYCEAEEEFAAGGGMVVYDDVEVSLRGTLITECRVAFTSSQTERTSSSMFFAVGGGVYIESGKVFVSGSSAIRHCAALSGNSLFIAAGAYILSLPLLPGHWAPAAECIVYREACPREVATLSVLQPHADTQGSPACLAARRACSLLPDRLLNDTEANAFTMPSVPIHYCPPSFTTEPCDGGQMGGGYRGDFKCQPRSFVQPCDWQSDSSILGKSIYQLPYEPVDTDLPFVCAAGFLGSARPSGQRSSSCAGKCPAGYVCPTPSTLQPQSCPAGHFCPAGSAVATPCPSGSFTTASNLSAAHQCEECPTGHFCAAPAASPTPCAPGSFAAVPGLSQCAPVPAGGYQRLSAATDFSPCLTGHYCPEASSVPISCHDGFYSASTNLSAAQQCSRCPRGHSCAAPAAEPVPCAPGFFAADTERSFCEPCPAGSFANSSAASACAACAAGRLCPSGASFELPADCAPGSFANASDTSGLPQCISCPVGAACAGGAAPPRECLAGSFAATAGQSECDACGPGSYQEGVGASGCRDCPIGSWCGAGAATPSFCAAGRFGAAFNQTSPNCSGTCAVGHYCAAGSTSPFATPCPAGSQQPLESQSAADACKLCPPGFAADAAAATECVACDAGSYAATAGRQECRQCPPRTTSGVGSDACDMCAAGYFRFDSEPASTASCRECVEGALCPPNATVSSLVLRTGYWRLSATASVLTKCEEPNGEGRCIGGQDAGVDGDGYCKYSSGPECKVCTSLPDAYYNEVDGRCADCPPVGRRVGITVGIVLGLAALCLGSWWLAQPRVSRRLPPWLAWLPKGLRRLGSWFSEISGFAKLKIAFSFVQIASSFSTTYGVSFPSFYTEWMRALWPLHLQLPTLLLPSECMYDSYKQLVIAWGTAPICAMAAVALALVAIFGCRSALRRRRQGCDGSSSLRLRSACADAARHGTLASLPVALGLTFALAAPISSLIFSAWLCQSYQVDGESLSSHAFLRAQLDLRCSDDQFSSTGHDELKATAAVFVGVWPVGVVILYAALLLRCRVAIAAHAPTALSKATAFLHRDYLTHAFAWELLELVRRTVLTGWLLMLPYHRQLERLLAGLLVCVAALVLLLLVRPYRLRSDFHLSACSHLFLVLLFIGAIIVNQWEAIADYSGEEVARSIVGFSSTDAVAATMLGFAFGLLLLLVLLAVIETLMLRRAARRAQIFSVCTMEPPSFNWLPVGRYAAFISHYKLECASDARFLHDALRKMLRCPIYLDSSTLADLRTLFTEGIAESDVLLLLASKSVLRRPWCMLEVLHAQRQHKPILLVEMVASPIDVEETSLFIDNLESQLDYRSCQLLQQHVGKGPDLSELKSAMRGALSMLQSSEVEIARWNPAGSDLELVADLKAIASAMGCLTNRNVRFSEPRQSTRSSRPDVWCGEAKAPIAYIAFSPSDAASEARVLRSALGRHLGRPAIFGRTTGNVRNSRRSKTAGASRLLSKPLRGLMRLSSSQSIDVDGPVAQQIRACECLLVMLTRNVLDEVTTLLAVWEAVQNHVPVLTVHLDRGGYDYDEAFALLSELKQRLSPEARSTIESHLGGVHVDELQRQLLETLPNLIAISWQSHAGPTHAELLVEQVDLRLKRIREQRKAARRADVSEQSMSLWPAKRLVTGGKANGSNSWRKVRLAMRVRTTTSNLTRSTREVSVQRQSVDGSPEKSLAT